MKQFVYSIPFPCNQRKKEFHTTFHFLLTRTALSTRLPINRSVTKPYLFHYRLTMSLFDIFYHFKLGKPNDWKTEISK